jgi:protocatechuate 3,4-dioxygenase beta subunit
MFTHVLSSQDTSLVIKQLATALRDKKITVNIVLTAEKYMHLHSNPAFRMLMKEFAPTGKITIVTKEEPGKRIKVRCSVLDSLARPFSNALVYIYQTSAKGWYADTAAHILTYEGDMRHARLFGYVITDKDGNFEVETIQPSGYPKSDLPAHIHISIWRNEKYVAGVPGELLFDDDERLTSERRKAALRDGFLIASDMATPSSSFYFYSIKLKQ